MSDGAEAVGLDVRELDIDSIESNAWNPNKMGEDAFNRLVKEIEDVGFLDPVQVVELDTGKFRLLGGEHRLEAMRTLGRASVPAVVLKGEKWKDEDLQKMVTVRLNVLKGNLDPGRMALLYDEMAAKYGDDALQDLFAYTDKGAFDKMLAGIQRGLKSAGLPKQAQKKFNAATKEIKSVEDLSMILNDMFSKYGDTVEQDFMVFTYGKKDHVYVAMDRKMKTALKKIVNHCRDSGESMTDTLRPAIADIAKQLKPTKKKAVAAAKSEDPVDF